MRGRIRQDAEKKRRGASTTRRKRRREGESEVVWTSGERNVASGSKERCDASQDAQDVQDAEYPALASGRNAGGSDARSIFADAQHAQDAGCRLGESGRNTTGSDAGHLFADEGGRGGATESPIV